MVIGVVADTEYLPGGWIADQILALSYFNAAVINRTTTDVEFVAKYTTGMLATCYVEILALTPFIPVYPVDFHCGKFLLIVTTHLS